jgi:hypothetical protein
MMWMMPVLALALVQTAPSPEAEALGKRLAETGTLAAMLPMIVAKDRESLVAEHPELSDSDKTRLRETADEVAKAGIDRLMTATGHAYAATLSIEDLKVLVAFNESEPAIRWRAATPGVIAAAMTDAGDLNFKVETIKAFCAKTGKACK